MSVSSCRGAEKTRKLNELMQAESAGDAEIGFSNESHSLIAQAVEKCANRR